MLSARGEMPFPAKHREARVNQWLQTLCLAGGSRLLWLEGLREIPGPSDAASCHLGHWLPACVAFLDQQLLAEPPRRVVVHCASGVSRSPAIVATYLHMRGYPGCASLEEAFAFVQSRRNQAFFDTRHASALHAEIKGYLCTTSTASCPSLSSASSSVSSSPSSAQDC